MRIIPGFLFFVLATAAITAERVDSLPEVLAMHEKALGAPLQSLELELQISKPGFRGNARYVASRDAGMRLDVFADGKRVFSEGLDSNGAWQLPADANAAVAIDGTNESVLRRAIVANLFGLHERPALGYQLCYDGHKTVDGTAYWQVSSTAPDGFRETFLINVKTGLIDRKLEARASDPLYATSERWFVTEFSSYRSIADRKMSFEIERRDAASGQPLVQILVTNARANSAIPADTFAARLL